MNSENDGKPPNLIMRIGAVGFQLGLEGYSKPFVERSSTKYASKSEQQIETQDIDFIYNSCLNQTMLPRTSYSNDISCFNCLFSSSLLVYTDVDQMRGSLREHLKTVILDLFIRSELDHLNGKMILITNEETPQVYLDIVIDLLLNHFLLRCVIPVPDPLMSSISAGIGLSPNQVDGCIIIDFGWRFTRVSCIYDNRILAEFSDLSLLSCGKIHYELSQKYSQYSFKQIEKLICTLDNFMPESDIVTQFQDDRIPQKDIIQTIIETLFPLEELDKDERPIDQMVHAVLEKLPRDIKVCLSSKVIISGGLNRIPGFEQFILSKLMGINPNIKRVSSLGAWQGASLYSAKILRNTQRHIKLNEFRR